MSHAKPENLPTSVAESVKSIKYLRFRNGVKRTKQTDIVIARLVPYFNRAKIHAKVTSVLRIPEDQLRIIKQYAIKKNILPKNSKLNMIDTMIFENQTVPVWQWVWSRLLNIGVIINPPVRARVLMDYIRNGANRKGTMIDPSTHFRGTAFDIGGGRNIGAITPIVVQAQKDNIGIKSHKIERENNAVHCNT